MIRNKENLQIYRQAAQFFTIVSAVTYGLLWFVIGMGDIESGAIIDLGNVLLVCTVIGGIAMGLLYVIKITKRRKRNS